MKEINIKRKTLVCGMVLALVAILFAGVPMNVSAEESSTYYISDDATGGDATTIGTWDWPTKTCTLTMDVDETIEIVSDGITLNGNGYTVTYGSGRYGILVRSQSEVTIKDLDIDGFEYGIYIYDSIDCSISDNTINDCKYGFYSYRTENSNIKDNTITNSDSIGMYIYASEGLELTENSMSTNDRNFDISGYNPSHYVNDIDETNLVESKPILYSINEQTKVYDGDIDGDHGLVYVIGGNDVTVKNMELSTNNYYSVYLRNCIDSTIENIEVEGVLYGIYVYNSEGSTIESCTVDDCYYGIWITSSDDATVDGNTVTDCQSIGLRIYGSESATVSDNTITDCDYRGMVLSNSGGSTLTGNSMASNVLNFDLSVSTTDTYNIDETNTVEGKAILYSEDEENVVYDGNIDGDYGVVYVINGDGITVKNSMMALNNYYNVYFYYTSDSTVENLQINGGSYGISLRNSEGSTITGNTVSNVENTGISLYNSDCSTISGNTISDNSGGISLSYTSGSTISSNAVSNNENHGIYLYYSEDSTLSSNNVIGSGQYGIYLVNSGASTTMSENSMSSNKYNFHIKGSGLDTCSIDTSNTVEGKAILYSVNENDVVYDGDIDGDYGVVYVVNGDGVTVKNSVLAVNNYYNVYVYYSPGSTLENLQINDGDIGFYLYYSDGSNINDNTIANNYYYGIRIDYSDSCTLSGNTILNIDFYGILLDHSESNTIDGNTIANNNYYGIYFYYSNYNTIFHNNFIVNKYHIYIALSSSLTWDNSAGEGNYWNDYDGLDDGSNDRTADDGIGDTNLPHRGLDNYPLMYPYELDEQIEDIVTDIKDMNLPKGTENNLVSKLNDAKKLYEKENFNGMVHKLGDFIDYVTAQSGNNIPEEQADELIAAVELIIYFMTA